jgi:tryptophan-rich hypothetical protein
MALPKQYARLVGSKWTAAREVLGWRQFHAISVRREPNGGYAVELAASCEAARRTWVPADTLLGRDGWTPGWTPLSLLAPEEPPPEGAD